MTRFPSTLLALSCAVEATSLAVAYGGPVFARAALRQSLKEISSEKERGKLMEKAWNRFATIDLTAHAAFTASWLVTRRTIRPYTLRRETRQLIRIKDVLVAGALATGVANVIAGRLMQREFPEGVPLDACGNVSPDQPEAAKYQRYFRFMGPLNMAFVSGALAIGPAIGATVARPRRSLLSYLFG